jgi:hypothetical protein
MRYLGRRNSVAMHVRRTVERGGIIVRMFQMLEGSSLERKIWSKRDYSIFDSSEGWLDVKKIVSINP